MRSKEAVQLRILELCEQHNMSVNALARHCGIRQSTLSNIVRGRNNSATIYTVARICRGLRITISDFFSAEYFLDIEQEIY